jgi:hypothetical protein
MSDTKKPTPAARITIFPVSAAIWRNVNEKGDAYYGITYERSYRDAEGKWRSSDTFGINESLLLSKVADLAHSKACELRANDRKAGQPEDEAA